MVKIDGNKIKRLRESQGLTQLYIATVVEVTTDTISRWENKRYPTIKQENGLKLAEALGVELDEILLEEENSVSPAVEQDSGTSAVTGAQRARFIKISGIFFLLLAVIVVVLVFFRKAEPVIQAQRIMPASTIPDSPFPVVIEVSSNDSSAISLILKETLPQGSAVLKTHPSAGPAVDSGQIKWLQKINGKTRFSYMVQLTGKPGREATFAGSVAVAENHGVNTSIKVSGSDTVRLGTSHWADNNGDNQISDQEILTVFDKYSGAEDFKIDIDLIEKMWLGSSYTWDIDKKNISISP